MDLLFLFLGLMGLPIILAIVFIAHMINMAKEDEENNRRD